MGLGINEGWRAFVPSIETKTLRVATNELAHLRTDVKAAQKAPEFQLFVNGIVVTNDKAIGFSTTLGQRTIQQASMLLPGTGNVQRLVISIRNTGNLPADRLWVGIRLPAELNCQMGGAWQPLAYVARNPSGFTEDNSQSSFFSQSAQVIDPGAYFSCDAIVVTNDFSNSITASLLIEVSAMRAEKKRFNLTTVFVKGEGPPQVLGEE